MADQYLAIISESEFAGFAKRLPRLMTPHAAYLEQIARREAGWASTPGNRSIRVLVELADLKAYEKAGRAMNLPALTVLALEKAYGLPTLQASGSTIIKVTAHEKRQRPTINLWIAATSDAEAALAAVKKHAKADWIIEADGPAPERFAERHRLLPGEACPFPPPK